MPYIILKHVKRSTGQVVPVILLDSSHEVLEFIEKDEALALANLLELNSDSGHKYEVKSTADKKEIDTKVNQSTKNAIADARDIMESFDDGAGMTVGFDDDSIFRLTGKQMAVIAGALYLADCSIK